MQIEDYQADIEMYLKQIKALCNLMIETDNVEIANIMTIKDLSDLAINIGKNT